MTAGDQASQAPGGSPAAERIAKRMARAGLCSRRDAERWIAEGRVKLDGEVLTSPAVTVTAASRIEVDGKPLPTAAPARLFRFHKPTGYLTAARDPERRKTIADLIPKELPRLMPVGRLDMNSEGLLLLTNDGALKRQLELPTTGWQRRYRVRVHGDVDEAKLGALIDGISIDGFDYGPIEARLERRLGKNAWLDVALREGKNREIRKVMEHFGWPVNRLIRVSFGPFHLGNLAKGDVDEVKTKVVKEQVGLVLQSATPASQRKRRLKARPNKKAATKEHDAPLAKGETATVEKPKARIPETLKLRAKPRQAKGAKGKPRSGSGPSKHRRSEPARSASKASGRKAGSRSR
ncbi:MAG: rRNA pseudouridine synthase [Alphaproteobacteria bacterium]|nr:rRNA pseudouridine synthase [Alphaproteobacteria bacterium]